ncbi:WS/DGAT/MGAT family O-acyltransferase [Ilumatobacter nonamiensis]|uniref:WS/DGAT/MGAT family O-acyltransferase n=1 Tax=Ilumatobacter nonamiensis TaxID=467093 RepID=UPI00034A5C8F|nr:wax ester/triacylglycerol synthase family O-acyltransferase [Ilumatobacter nonamiensis]
MKQLTGIDASFLYMETPNTYGHVNGLAIYERPSPDFEPFEHVYERFGIMVDHLEPMRRRLVEVPFGLDHPYWIDDPDFDLDYHVRHLGLAPPGAADQLSEQVARIVGRHMDRRRPLWEVYVIEGLADGRWALFSKTHHATIDGASGVIMLKMMTEASPDAEFALEPVAWQGEEVPRDIDLLTSTVQHLAKNPVKAARLQLKVVRQLAEAAGVDSVSGAASQARDAIKSLVTSGDDRSRSAEDSVSIPLTPAPPTPWNASVTPNRRFAMRSVALENVKVLKDATGGTINDVVMAMCAGALREYLLMHDVLPDEPLRAMVPVSIRTGDEEDVWTNRVSGIIAELPTNCEDPVERVALCREAMQAAKRQFELVPAEAMMEGAQLTSPVIAASAIRLVSRLKLADRVNSPVNVVISNVPGPREPLYFAGAKLDAYIPVSTISDGVGLNITVHSYEDRLDIGLISDRELVPDLWDLVDLHVDEIARLFEATGAEWAVAQAPPAMRRGGLGVESRPPRSADVAARLARKQAVTDDPSVGAETPATRKSAASKKKVATKKVAKKKPAKKRASAKKKAAGSKTAAKRSTTTKSSSK